MLSTRRHHKTARNFVKFPRLNSFLTLLGSHFGPFRPFRPLKLPFSTSYYLYICFCLSLPLSGLLPAGYLLPLIPYQLVNVTMQIAIDNPQLAGQSKGQLFPLSFAFPQLFNCLALPLPLPFSKFLQML